MIDDNHDKNYYKDEDEDNAMRRRRLMTRKVGRTIQMKEMRSMINTRRRCVMIIRARM
jgi:hypothetical protein